MAIFRLFQIKTLDSIPHAQTSNVSKTADVLYRLKIFIACKGIYIFKIKALPSKLAIMKIEECQIILVILGLFLISSFVPIIQIMLGYLNGAFLYLIQSITTVRGHHLAIPFNSILSVICLIAFWKSKKQSYKIITASLSSFFISCKTLFVFEDFLLIPRCIGYNSLLGL